MDTLTLDTIEASTLREILDAHLAQLRVEIGRADTLAFKNQLLERYRVVEGLLSRFDGASGRGVPVPSAPIL